MSEPGQGELIEGLLKKVESAHAATAIRAARDLRWMTEQDGAILYRFRKALIRAAMGATEVRVRSNLIIVLGRLPLKGNDRAGVVDWLFERLGDDSGLVRTIAPGAVRFIGLRARVTAQSGAVCGTISRGRDAGHASAGSEVTEECGRAIAETIDSGVRPFEWILAAMALAGAMALLARQRNRATAWCFSGATVVLLAMHQWREGVHWQLIPLYVAVVFVALMLFRPGRLAWLSAAGVVLLLASLGMSWVLPMFRLPAPTGPYAVGTRIFFLKDGVRQRELVTQVWYPAEALGEKARYVRPKEVRPLGRYQAQIRTNSYLDAPIAKAGGTFPVVIFGHKWGGRRTQDTFLAEELASHGYVVVATDHPGNAAIVELEDGSLILSTMAAALDMSRPPAEIEALWNKELEAWVADDEFVLNALTGMSADGASWVSGRLDMTRVGAVGHSFGGAASMRLLGTDPRVKCAVNMDGWTFGGLEKRTTQPVLYLYAAFPEQRDPHPERPPTGASNDDQLDRIDRSIVDGSLARYGGYKGYVWGTQHADFTDETLVSPLQRLTYSGPLAGKRAREITRSVVLGFLDQNLKGKGNIQDFAEIRWVAGK